MSNKLLSIVLMVTGVLVLAGSLLGDAIGIGHHPGLGFYQIAGVVVGLVVALVGLWLFFKRKA